MQFIRIRQPDAVEKFCRTEAEARILVKHLVLSMGIEAARNDLKIEVVDIPADKDTLYDLINGTLKDFAPIGEYYITPRGALKRDRE